MPKTLVQGGNRQPVKIDTSAIPKVEVRLLCKTFLDAVKAFYKDPKNLAGFEEWRKEREKEAGKQQDGKEKGQ